MCKLHYTRWNEGYTGTLLDCPPEPAEMSAEEAAKLDAAAEVEACKHYAVAMTYLMLKYGTTRIPT